MKKKFVVSLIVALVFLPAVAMAEKVVFATTEWPPYVIKEGENSTGIDVETVREVCKHLGIESKFEILPWARAVKYVKEGTDDAIFAIKKTDERTEFLYFPEEPVAIEKTIIASRKGSNAKITGIDDLKGKDVGIVRDFSYGSEFDNNREIKKTVCNDDETIIKMLEKGRLDFGALGEDNMKIISKKLGFQDRFEVVYVLSEVPNYVGFSKKALGKKGETLAEKFGKALRQLKEDGVIQKIRDKYF